MPTTDLDDLKIAWKELNRQVERQNALTLRQIKENKSAAFVPGFGRWFWDRPFNLSSVR